MKQESHPLRVGLFGIGLEAYWPQFDGHALRRFDAFTAYRIRILFYCCGLAMRPRLTNS